MLKRRFNLPPLSPSQNPGPLAFQRARVSSRMQPSLRFLLYVIGLFLIFTFSFLPIFYEDVTRAVAPAFDQLGYKPKKQPAAYLKYFHEGREGGALHHYDGRFQHASCQMHPGWKPRHTWCAPTTNFARSMRWKPGWHMARC